MHETTTTNVSLMKATPSGKRLLWYSAVPRVIEVRGIKTERPFIGQDVSVSCCVKECPDEQFRRFGRPVEIM